MPELPAARRRGRPSAGAREAILAAAGELIAEAGLGCLTTREVARRAGVSEASVFYHYEDKAGLLEQVVLAGLTPLRALPPATAGPAAGGPLADALRPLATALEAFFDHAMPVLAAVGSDPGLRHSFAERLVRGDLGPHRGLELMSAQLAELAAVGRARQFADPGPVALLLLGACFLRSWERQLAGGGREPTLPGLAAVVEALGALLAPGQDPVPAPTLSSHDLDS